MITASTMDTPAGPLTILTLDAAVVAAGFTADVDRMFDRLPTDRRREGYHVVEELGDTTKAILRYLDGDLDALNEVTVDQTGTPYQQAIWAGLRAIAPGGTTSYGVLAAGAGAPTAARAAGSACGANLVAPFVPCHRAVLSSGALGGYEYGLPVKRWLLDHEARHSTRSAVHVPP